MKNELLTNFRDESNILTTTKKPQNYDHSNKSKIHVNNKSTQINKKEN